MSKTSQWKNLRNDVEIPGSLAEFLINLNDYLDHQTAADLTIGFAWDEHFEALENNEHYKKWYETVEKILAYKAADEGYRRAVIGVEVPLTHRGEKTGEFVTERSDSLLKTILDGKWSAYGATQKKSADGDEDSNPRGVVLVLPENGRSRLTVRDIGDQPG